MIDDKAVADVFDLHFDVKTISELKDMYFLMRSEAYMYRLLLKMMNNHNIDYTKWENSL